jgi:hypothetical protein
MKLINIFLLMLTFLSAQGTKFGDKTIDGYIGFPTITYTKTNGTLSSYYDGEIRDTKNWAKGDELGNLNEEIRLTVLLPISNEVSLMFSSMNAPKYYTIYRNSLGFTQQSKYKEESWKKTTIGIKVAVSPSWFGIKN